MAEAAIPCSSGCTVQMGSIRDRRLPVKRRTERFLRPRQDTPPQSFAARLSFFTSRVIGSLLQDLRCGMNVLFLVSGFTFSFGCGPDEPRFRVRICVRKSCRNVQKSAKVA